VDVDLRDLRVLEDLFGDRASLAYGTVISGSIDLPGQIRRYEFSALADDMATLTLLTPMHTLFMVSLIAPDETVVFSQATDNRRWPNLFLDQTGTYELVVRSHNGTTGAYTMALSDQPIEALPFLSVNGTVSGSIDRFGDVDDWPFMGSEGQVVTLYADAPPGPLHMAMRVLDSSRAVIATGIALAGYDSQIVDLSIPADGEYLVQVYPGPLSTTELGDYELHLWE
jgi:hypothetical protein